MERLKRNERMVAMIKILTEEPSHILKLSYFGELFGASKSTISEDIVIARDIFKQFNLGELETIAGATGGVQYRPMPILEKSYQFIQKMCLQLSEPERILSGGFLYMTDILSTPQYVERMGEILASQFYNVQPDFVVTVESKGIPIALMTARALHKPLVVARRDNKITEGSVVTINYLTGSNRRIQTMSLAKRAVKEGQKALIIDDFMKGGGTAKGMEDMMSEFNVNVVGIGVMMETEQPVKKMVEKYKSLIIMKNVDEIGRRIDVEPSIWLTKINK